MDCSLLSIAYFARRDHGNSTLWVKEHLFAFKGFSRNECHFALPSLHAVLLKQISVVTDWLCFALFSLFLLIPQFFFF